MESPTPQWYCVTLNPQQLAAGEKRRLARQAAEIYLNLGKPPGVAVFSTSFNDAGNVTIFFSPDAAVHMRELIQAVNGSPCDAPNLSAEDLAVIAGDLSAKLQLL